MTMCGRRQTVCAAFALVCALLCASAAWGVYDRTFIQPEDFTPAASECVNYSIEHQGLSLTECARCVPFLWVPCPGESAVSRIDARTGNETARYRLGPARENWQPCAIATDERGNAYVACTSGRIVRIAHSGDDDKNGDGAYTSSGDFDCNRQITPSEVLAWGRDDRVSLFCEIGPTGCMPTSIIFDDAGYLWVTLAATSRVIKLNPSDGEVIGEVGLTGKPSAMVMGPEKNLWILSPDNAKLWQIDTQTHRLTRYYTLEDCIPGGLTIDQDGVIWIGNLSGGLMSLDTETCEWQRYSTNDGAGFAGVTVDKGGDIWAACPSKGEVAIFAGDSGELVATLPVGVTPGSVCVDADGYIWVLADQRDYAMRIDVRTNKVVQNAHTGAGPFSSTPFAACTLQPGVMPTGSWTTVVDSKLAGAAWGRISWGYDACGGSIRVEVRASDNVETLPMRPFQAVQNGIRFEAPKGRYLEVKVVFQGTGDTSPVLKTLRIEGTNQAPDLSAVVSTVSIITKTDHTFEPVSIIGAKDPEGDPFEVTITGITQDEPISGLGPDDKSPDAMLLGANLVWLRGECDEGTEEEPGNGRVYTVSYKVVDALGASSSGRVKVSVPRIISATEKAVEDKAKYDSTGGKVK